MPRFGICGPLAIAEPAAAAGWEYIEGSVQTILQGDAADDHWTVDAKASALPCEAANFLLPPDLKVVGPSVDQARIERYVSRIFPRAAKLGIQTIVFGSGGARGVPDDFDRDRAKAQIIAFAKLAAEHAGKSNVTLVFEPLNQNECNIINSVREGIEFTKAVDHPNMRCLVDSYHFWLEKEPLADLASAMPLIRHVHVADEHGRESPGYAPTPSDYRAFFKTLKQGGYDGRISVEGKIIESQFAQTLDFLKREWNAA